MAVPSTPLLEFLLRLRDDVEFRRRFDSDENATMVEAGLSAEESEAVASRDLERLQAALPPGQDIGGISSCGNTPGFVDEPE